MTTSVTGFTVRVMVAATDVTGVVALSVPLNAILLPDAMVGAVGVPETTPVLLFSVMPAGRVPELTA